LERVRNMVKSLPEPEIIEALRQDSTRLRMAAVRLLDVWDGDENILETAAHEGLRAAIAAGG
jgi:hypothetical protein